MTTAPQPTVRVLMFPLRHAINPYLNVLKASLEMAGVQNATGRQLWSARPPEVVLVHWQENLWAPGRAARQRLANPLRRRLLLWALRRLRRRGSTVVWFAHNQMPHSWEGSFAAWLARAKPFFAEVDAVAYLNETACQTEAFAYVSHLPSLVVRHPHYALVNPEEHSVRAGPVRRLLLLGGLERRKNAGGALRAILQTPELTAVVTGDGRPLDPLLASPRVQVIEGLVSETALTELFDGGTAVLLNQAEQLNSGVMYLALSRGAPVICPDTAVNREIQALVGREWVRLFGPPLNGALLHQLTETPIPSTIPDMTIFSPARIGRSFLESIGPIRAMVRAGSLDAEPPGSLQRSIDTHRGQAHDSLLCGLGSPLPQHGPGSFVPQRITTNPIHGDTESDPA